MVTTTQAPKGAVLITGAAGGIGTATVRQLNASGFHVFAGVRKASDGQALQRDISAQITPVLLDITDPTSIASAAETVAKAVGSAGLAGLVNNAGLIVEGPVELVPMEEARKQFEVNVLGQIAVTQAFLPLLRLGHGRIVNIGAVSGKIALPFAGVLSASKAALESLTDALRVELRPWGIAVSIVEPAGMQTRIFDKSAAAAQQARQQFSTQKQQLYASAIAAVSKYLATQHLDAPDVVAAAILHALTARNPKTRYPVGQGARMVVILGQLPDRLRDGLVQRILGLPQEVVSNTTEVLVSR
jgi:NAD(P)-dependent dehydrogenase (short-subunit alcohol dehydrogenase family)